MWRRTGPALPLPTSCQITSRCDGRYPYWTNRRRQEQGAHTGRNLEKKKPGSQRHHGPRSPRQDLTSRLWHAVAVHSLSCLCLFATPWASLSLPISRSLPKFMFIPSVMPSSHFILWRPLPFCPESFPASGTLPKSRLFASDDQNIGASTSASVLPMNIQGWSPLR